MSFEKKLRVLDQMMADRRQVEELELRARPPVAGVIEAVSASPTHTMSKVNQREITLAAGLGIVGDAHMGATVKHRSRVRRDPGQPNLRQVHLIQAELLDELNAAGFKVTAGQLGENVTTRELDLLALATGTRLHVGENAVIEVTGLRNPCEQLNGIQPDLMERVLGRDSAGNLVRRCGVMGVVIASGVVRPGDEVTVELPAAPHMPLQPV
jgi:MOSC domain-containing protein YiiM